MTGFEDAWIRQMEAEPLNVWSVKGYFGMFRKFPQMTEENEIIFLDFCKSQVDHFTEAYEECLLQGSNSKETIDTKTELWEAERMYFAFQDHIVDTKARRASE